MKSIRAGGIVAAASLALSLAACAPSESIGLDIGDITCHVDPGSGQAVMQVPVSARAELQFEPAILDVALDDSDGLEIEGLGVIDAAEASSAAEEIASGRLRKFMNDENADHFAATVPADEDSLMVFLLGFSDGNTDGSSESFRIFWGGGEPVYWQQVDVSVAVADSTCVLGET